MLFAAPSALLGESYTMLTTPNWPIRRLPSTACICILAKRAKRRIVRRLGYIFQLVSYRYLLFATWFDSCSGAFWSDIPLVHGMKVHERKHAYWQKKTLNSRGNILRRPSPPPCIHVFDEEELLCRRIDTRPGPTRTMQGPLLVVHTLYIYFWYAWAF